MVSGSPPKGGRDVRKASLRLQLPHLFETLKLLAAAKRVNPQAFFRLQRWRRLVPQSNSNPSISRSDVFQSESCFYRLSFSSQMYAGTAEPVRVHGRKPWFYAGIMFGFPKHEYLADSGSSCLLRECTFGPTCRARVNWFEHSLSRDVMEAITAGHGHSGARFGSFSAVLAGVRTGIHS